MSEWITDWRPTESDGDRLGMVWVSDNDKTDYVARRALQYVGDLPWQPINQPDPYEPPKPPKPLRREWWLERKDIRDCWLTELHHPGCPVAEGHIHVREVLEGDPTPEMVEEVANALNVAGCQTDSNGNAFIKGESLKRLAAKLRGESDV